MSLFLIKVDVVDTINHDDMDSFISAHSEFGGVVAGIIEDGPIVYDFATGKSIINAAQLDEIMPMGFEVRLNSDGDPAFFRWDGVDWEMVSRFRKDNASAAAIEKEIMKESLREKELRVKEEALRSLPLEKKTLSDGTVVYSEPGGCDQLHKFGEKVMVVGKMKRLRDLTMRFNRKRDEFKCTRCILKVAGQPASGWAPVNVETNISNLMEVYRAKMMQEGHIYGLVWFEFSKTGSRRAATHYLKLLLEVPLRKKPDYMNLP